jgi:hypothetical protein
MDQNIPRTWDIRVQNIQPTCYIINQNKQQSFTSGMKTYNTPGTSVIRPYNNHGSENTTQM